MKEYDILIAYCYWDKSENLAKYAPIRQLIYMICEAGEIRDAEGANLN